MCHVVGDWILQPQKMALNKTSCWKTRFLHCLIYTSCFLFVWPHLSVFALAWIFLTHFIIDSYKPLFWFRKLRGDFNHMTFDPKSDGTSYTDFEKFKKSFETTSGFFVNICFDQIFHLLTFLPILLKIIT